MTDTTQTPAPEPVPPLSPQTEACVVNLTRSKADVEAWTHNLEQALADDVANGRLTQDQAAQVASDNDVTAPPAPGTPAEAQVTTPEMNQAQLDAQTKANEAAAAAAAGATSTPAASTAPATSQPADSTQAAAADSTTPASSQPATSTAAPASSSTPSS